MGEPKKFVYQTPESEKLSQRIEIPERKMCATKALPLHCGELMSCHDNIARHKGPIFDHQQGIKRGPNHD